jgi:hypothetical protein
LSDWPTCGDRGGGDDFGAKKSEPAGQQGEVVADGGEDGFDGIAVGMGEVISIHAMF